MHTIAAPPHPPVCRLLAKGFRALVMRALVYLGVVVGGTTGFLALAPLFGYLAYSDRPGPGWYGRFPAMGWAEFVRNAGDVMSIGAFFVTLFVLPALVVAAVAGPSSRPPASRRVAGGAAGMLLSGWWMAGGGWFMAAGWPLAGLAAGLGLIAGAWAVPGPLPPRTRRVLAGIPLLLLCALPVEILRDMGPRHAFAVYVRADATPEETQRVWQLATEHPDHPRAVESGGAGGAVDGSAVLVFTFRPRTPEHVRAAVQEGVRASGLADSVVARPPAP
ncbi:MAG TPA: hypothetical protein VF142_20265 [Longimicrobium sp.]